MRVWLSFDLFTIFQLKDKNMQLNYFRRCVGNVFKKVGKVTALAIGGGLLVLQVR